MNFNCLIYFIYIYIYLLIQTLQCERKHIIHESILQTFNPPISQLLLCPEWLWCHYKCHSSLLLENSHARHSILAVFFLQCVVIKPPGIFLLHISGSVDYWFYVLCICIALSSPWLGKRGPVYMLLSISELVHLYAPTFMFAHSALCKK